MDRGPATIADGLAAAITERSAANHGGARNADGLATAITDRSAAHDGGATSTDGLAAAIADRSAAHDGGARNTYGCTATITDRAAAHDGGPMTRFHNAGRETSNKAEDYDHLPHALSFRARMSLCERCARGAETSLQRVEWHQNRVYDPFGRVAFPEYPWGH